MEKCGEITCELNSGLGLFRLGFWLPLALLLYVLSIGPAVRFGGNHSEVAILLYKPVGWACHQSRPFDTLVTRRIKLWDRGPVPAGAARYGANNRVESNRRCIFPLRLRSKFERAFCAPPALSAAVAHSNR